MAAICNICFDSLGEAPEAPAETEQGPVQEGQDVAVAGPSTRAAAKSSNSVDGGVGATAVIIAMQCGHVYHQDCITQWLTKKLVPRTRGAAPTFCPTCNARVTIKKGLRLFLQHEADPVDVFPPMLTAETTENADNTDELEDHEEVPKKKKRTEEEEHDMKQISSILEDTTEELDVAKAEIEALKVECALLRSELDATKAELEEAKQFNRVVQENWDLNVETVRRQQPTINSLTQPVKQPPPPVYPSYLSRLPAGVIQPVFGSSAPAAVGNAGNQNTANGGFGGIAAGSKYVANSNHPSTANHSSAAPGVGKMKTAKTAVRKSPVTRKATPKPKSTATKNMTATATVTGKPGGPEPAGANSKQLTTPVSITPRFVLN